MFFINFYAAPIAEQVDRDKAVAAVRLALRTPAYTGPSPEGKLLGSFGPTGKTLGLKGFQLLMPSTGSPCRRKGPHAPPPCRGRTASG